MTTDFIKLNELVGKIKNAYLYAQTGSTKAVLEDILPELKESKDERIRKVIYDWIYLRPSQFFDDGFSKEEMLAWLEKQGIPSKLSEEEQHKFAKGVLTSCALSFIGYLDAHRYEGKMCVSNGEYEDIENAFHNAMWDRLHRYYCKYIEKQGEQQHMKNIVETWKEMRLEVYAQASGNRHEPNYSDDTTKMFSLNDIDEIIEKISEQKPIDNVETKDYSSIDPHFGKPIDKMSADKLKPFDKYEGLTDFERALADICTGYIGEELGWKQYIKDNADILLKIAIKKFNSIQDVPFEQKSAWSEKDEEKFRDVIRLVEQGAPVKSMREHYTNWLKSLKDKYAWKPSDEQLDALQYVYRNFNPSPSDKLGWNSLKTLELMYHDLKKLKE